MPEPLRILIVEDNEDDALLLVRTLKQGGFDPEHRCVATAASAEAALDEPWDIIVADYSMPDFCGLEVLNRLHARRLDIPFILVSGTIGEEVAVEAMRAGAHDYIMKDHLALVPPAVKREIKEAEIRRQHRRAEERFRVVSEVATDIIYEWDLATDHLEWYGGIEAALGYASGEIAYTLEGWLALVYPADRALCQKMVARRRKASYCVYEHYRMVCKNGKLLHWLDRGAPILDRRGEPVRWVGGCSDVTESKRAENRLRDYQRRLKSLATELSLAEERERRRVAEGVHDNICQRLALAKLDLQSLQQTLENVGVIREIEKACHNLDRIMEDAHSLTFDLSNPVLYEVGLEAAVESWLARTVQGKYGLVYSFDAAMPGLQLDENVLIFLFQSIRELVTNVIKHAGAKRLKVVMATDGDGIETCIEDDGIGFDAASKEISGAGGFGLFSVRERLEYLGGQLYIDSTPGQGTSVKLRVPGRRGHRASAAPLADANEGPSR
jgi:two-component system sensor histidine kinase UhpB